MQIWGAVRAELEAGVARLKGKRTAESGKQALLEQRGRVARQSGICMRPGATTLTTLGKSHETFVRTDPSAHDRARNLPPLDRADGELLIAASAIASS